MLEKVSPFWTTCVRELPEGRVVGSDIVDPVELLCIATIETGSPEGDGPAAESESLPLFRALPQSYFPAGVTVVSPRGALVARGANGSVPAGSVAGAG